MLTAYFDDSGSERGERMLILAGYVHSAQTWLAFNDDWQTVLETAPAIKYLHMVEAENLRDEFKGWVREEMEEKVSALADVIVKHEPWSIECQVSHQDFSDIVQPVVPYELRTPYFACFYGVICNLVKWHASMGLTLPIDFVFDEQGAIGAQAVLWYETIKSMQPAGLASLFGSTPVFRDDKKILPLQAADLLAWHLRRTREVRYRDESRPVVNKLLPLLHSKVAITKGILRTLAEQMSKVPNIELTRRKPKNSKG
jgi:hypothetical protein